SHRPLNARGDPISPDPDASPASDRKWMPRMRSPPAAERVVYDRQPDYAWRRNPLAGMFDTMRPATLFSHRRYFGLDPVQLRNGARRLLARAGGQQPIEALTVGRSTLMREFGINPIAVRAFASELVQHGLLELHSSESGDRLYRATGQLEQIASAE